MLNTMKRLLTIPSKMRGAGTVTPTCVKAIPSDHQRKTSALVQCFDYATSLKIISQNRTSLLLHAVPLPLFENNYNFVFIIMAFIDVIRVGIEKLRLLVDAE